MSDEPPLECWTVDFGEFTVKIGEDEWPKVRQGMESLSTRVIEAVDIYGSVTFLMRDKILYLARHTVEGNAAARKRNRAYDAAVDALDPEGATKEWDK